MTSCREPPEAVRAWLDRPAGGFTFTTTPLSTQSTSDGATVVTCRVEGNFPDW
ncbi:hypothetical protein [Amycolatopsis sp. WQ 127309]|uniref:hypothetical protein n=1 Tax=Amycolatopsis sp. WQ 127309 TaxID=2932773 RepID=UPI001FF4CC5A|nr:hypothetical protein [Amycolatopsis sp. WQ 127309]UOZ03564.1 hypothetical protein MUY22_32515 [Amycolatopsis sp. WQ 127309]